MGETEPGPVTKLLTVALEALSWALTRQPAGWLCRHGARRGCLHVTATRNRTA